jgi:hypothetical protein
MSTRTAVVITCDHKGCWNEHIGYASEIEGNARLDAQGNHWGQRRVVVRGKVRWLDMCPDHKDGTE